MGQRDVGEFLARDDLSKDYLGTVQERKRRIFEMPFRELTPILRKGTSRRRS